MSWDADFDGRSWNYTHNTNRMIAAAYEAATGEGTANGSGVLGPVIGPAWWDRLNGLTGREGAALLALITDALEADPERYRAMNPENGWGSYDSLLSILREMQAAGESACCDERRWSVSG